MELKVETHPTSPGTRRLVAVPSTKHGFFVDRTTLSTKRIFKSVGIEGVTEEQIDAAERNELSAQELFEITLFDDDHYIIIAPDHSQLSAIAIEGALGDQSYSVVKVFQEAQLRHESLTD